MAKAIAGSVKYKVLAGVLGGVGLSGAAAGAAVTAVTVVKTQEASKEYTITFNSNKGSAVQAQKVLVGKAGVCPANPTRTGYEFVAWYTDPEFSKQYDWATKVDKDITLYAQYRLVETTKQVTLTYDLNGGTLVSGELTRKVVVGTKFGNLNVPNFSAPDGKMFDSWSVDKDYEIDGDLTVTAQYIDIPEGEIYHTINFCIDGSEKWDKKTETESLQISVKQGTTWKQVRESAQMPTIINPGYSIGNYYIPALTGNPDDAIVLDDETVFAEEKSYVFNINIHWDLVGAKSMWLLFNDNETQWLTWTGVQSLTVSVDTKWGDIEKPKVVQLDSVFKNWAIKNITGQWVEIDATTYKDTTLEEIINALFGQYQWPERLDIKPLFTTDVDYVTVTFTNNETAKGSISGTTTLNVIKGSTFGSINKPTTSPTNNWMFDKWVDGNGSAITDSAQINSNLTIYPKWVTGLDKIVNLYADEDSSITITKNSSNAFEYSTNGSNWTILGGSGTTQTTISLSAGQSLYIRGGDKSQYSDYEPNERGISGSAIKITSGNVWLSGSIMGLLSKTKVMTTVPGSGFHMVFASSPGLKNVSKGFLPATTIEYSGYYRLFYNCTNLVSAPNIAATTLTGSNGAQLYGMFENCSSLTSAPAELKPTTVNYKSYISMFAGCTSLKTPPIIKMTTIGFETCQLMFNGCSSLSITTDSTASGATEFFTCPSLSTYPSAANYMFKGTIGGIETPTENTTYYYIAE